MISKIKTNIWQICFNHLESCIYLLKLSGKNILIDTSAEENRRELIEELRNLKVEISNEAIVVDVEEDSRLQEVVQVLQQHQRGRPEEIISGGGSGWQILLSWRSNKIGLHVGTWF